MKQAQWLYVQTALDASNASVTLRFSLHGYVDTAGNYYEPRIITPALISVSPNDGGLLSLFNTSSTGDIELANKDGGLNYLADYALDGLTAQLIFYDGSTENVYFTGTASRLTDQDDRLVVGLRAAQETLADNLVLSVYAGTNVLPAGLEGTADDIKDNPKPIVLGDCRNISPVLVNSSLLIYQVSSRADCLITALYDEGAKLVNYRVSGAHSVGATSIAVGAGFGDIPTGATVRFGNQLVFYTVQTGLSGGHIVITPALSVAVPANYAVDVMNAYANTSDLQADIPFTVTTARLAKSTQIALTGIGTITAGDKVLFSNHGSIYTVQTGLTGGTIVLTSGLTDTVPAGTYCSVIIPTQQALWGSYQGYFRLAYPPVGAVTCDAVSVTSGVLDKAADVLDKLASLSGMTLDSTSKTELMTLGYIGLYIADNSTKRDLIDRVIKSLAAYYWVVNTTIVAKKLTAPSTTETFTIAEWQIKSISRLATGLGTNGLPIKSIKASYDRLESTQTNFAGVLQKATRERLKKQYREKNLVDSAATTRHKLAETLAWETLLRYESAVDALAAQLLSIIAVRRDVIELDALLHDIPAFAIGDTVNVVTKKLGYDAGKKLVLIGYTLDLKFGIVTLRLFG